MSFIEFEKNISIVSEQCEEARSRLVAAEKIVQNFSMNIQTKFLLTSELCCPRNAALGQKDFTECFIFFWENICTTEWKKAKRKKRQRKR